MSRYRQFYGQIIDSRREPGNPLEPQEIVAGLNSQQDEIERLNAKFAKMRGILSGEGYRRNDVLAIYDLLHGGK